LSISIAILIGLLIPFAGTTLGSGAAFLVRGELNRSVQRCFLGFASGVMIAASVWSLILPAVEMAETYCPGVPVWLPASAGFLAGIAFLLSLDKLIPHLHVGSVNPEGHKSSLGHSAMLVLAVTLHNIPEGMAVGVVFAGLLAGGENSVPMSAAFVLSIGIALQNIPEGAVISMPLVADGLKRSRSFLYGALSGVVEPLGGLLTILLTSLVTPALPYILTFAAGAMFYVVIEELIPEAQCDYNGDAVTICAAVGFVLMMVMDIALG